MDWLPLRRGPSHPLLALLRWVPGLAPLLPAPQAPVWGWATTYRVQIRPLVQEPCSGALCYAAVLLDAAAWPDPAPSAHL
jgi:hypothetical protein